MEYFDRMRGSLSQPDVDVAMLQVAYMNLKKMPRDDMRKVLEWILGVAPDNAAARLELVSYAWNRDDMPAVVELCRAARQYNPDNMGFYYYQGMAYYRMEDEDSALEAFQNGISVIAEDSNPDLASDFYSVMGDLLFQRGRGAEAFAAYDSCLQWKADNIGCLNNYAYYLSLEERELEKAERMSYKTIKAEPENATYLDTYAWILFLEGRYAESRVYIDQAVQHDADAGAVILDHAGDIHAMCGDMDKAVELWRKAAEKDAGNKTAEEKDKTEKIPEEMMKSVNLFNIALMAMLLVLGGVQVVKVIGKVRTVKTGNHGRHAELPAKGIGQQCSVGQVYHFQDKVSGSGRCSGSYADRQSEDEARRRDTLAAYGFRICRGRTSGVYQGLCSYHGPHQQAISQGTVQSA